MTYSRWKTKPPQQCMQNGYIRDLRALKPKIKGRKEYFVGLLGPPPKKVCYNFRYLQNFFS